MMQKWYEITCDECGCASHYRGTIVSAEAQARSDGIVITRDKKHYCGCKKLSSLKNDE